VSPKLIEILHQAETLPIDEQLQLIAQLVEKVRQMTAGQPALVQYGANQPVEAIAITGKSIWQLAEDFVKDLSDMELAKLPSDGAEQHDHYIYGTPKIG